MSEQTLATDTPEAALPPEVTAAVPQVSSPPKPKVIAPQHADPRAELQRLAGEVAKHGTRKLLWDYLKLRARVLPR